MSAHNFFDFYHVDNVSKQKTSAATIVNELKEKKMNSSSYTADAHALKMAIAYEQKAFVCSFPHVCKKYNQDLFPHPTLNNNLVKLKS